MNLLQTEIFLGLRESDIDTALEFLLARKKKFPKNAAIFHAGQTTRDMGIAQSGRVQIESCDFWGNRSILDSVGPGQAFAESYALSGRPLMVDAVAAEKSEILFLSVHGIFERRTRGKTEERIRTQIARNLLAVSAQKNLRLSRRIFCAGARTLRAKLLSYLSQAAVASDKSEFDIPFDRQQLADYLNADRSALCAELSKMKADGLVDYWKNHFRLLQERELR